MSSQALVEEVMKWVTTLHIRAPGSSVILVGTHRDECEGGGWFARLLARLWRSPSLDSVTADVEESLKSAYHKWKKRRQNDVMRPSRDDGVTVEEGVVLVSSLPEAPNNGFSELQTRLKPNNSTTSHIPPSWRLALVVLDALRDGQDPVKAAKYLLNIVQTPPPNAEDKRAWITVDLINVKWSDVQGSLPAHHMARDPAFAMENALHLR